MANFLRKTAGAIGKAIPNEFSKLNSFLKYIPYLGQANQVISSIDTGATAYGDTGNFQTAINAGKGGFYGSRDPGFYGSPNINRDWANITGQWGNVLGGDINGIGNAMQYSGVGSDKGYSPEPSLPNIRQQSQMSESELMMKQIRSLYAQYLFSQNQAALNPSQNQSGSYLPYVQTINPGYRL